MSTTEQLFDYTLRSHPGAGEVPSDPTPTLPMAKALNAGLAAAMQADDKVLLMGEDIGQLGGVFRITEGLQDRFGPERVRDTPLAEAGIIGTAIGLALRGYRPVVEIQFDGFVWPGFDQITSQLAKMANRLPAHMSLPVVIRIPYGGHIGAVEHHQESPRRTSRTPPVCAWSARALRTTPTG